ncbi:hypothetical protein P7C71_g5895, partial [Lecanoromycetidae sp. Uapishka_2]
MGFGDFETICRKSALPLCSIVGPESPISGSPAGIQANCYARSVELANTIIFEAATDFMHILALGMAAIMVLHVRSKFTAVGRKEITTFFYIYMALTMTSLVLDSGVIPPQSGAFPYFVAVQNGFTSALCTCLLVNGFVGFQLYEDGTTQSVWLLRGSSIGIGMASAAHYGNLNSANDLQGGQGGGLSAVPQHKRTYQACIPCRKRKVRCDLGPVDNPHEPPCVRCRRESKDCYFSATRRKRKADGGEDELEDDASLANDEYAARNGRKKSIRTSSSMRGYGHQGSPESLSVPSALDGYSVAGDVQYQQPRTYSTDATPRKEDEDPDQELANETAAALFQAPINTPGDALHLLLKASKENESFQRRDTESIGRRSASQSNPQHTSAPGDYKSPPHHGVNESRGQNYLSNIDPAISGNNVRQGKVASRIISSDTIRLWSRLRFVRAGWFTAREAVEYLD